MSEALATPEKEVRHVNSVARDFSIQFLYQCETEKIYLFTNNKCEDFIAHFQVNRKAADRMRELVQGVFENMPELDKKIAATSKNWHIDRMSVIDRSILRVALLEMIRFDTPIKVILDEAIELAKKYGTESSAAFVNGILDPLAKQLRS